MPNLVISFLVTEIRHRWQALRRSSDAGYTTETVVGTALLVALALLVITIIAVKVSDKANSINLGGATGTWSP